MPTCLPPTARELQILKRYISCQLANYSFDPMAHETIVSFYIIIPRKLEPLRRKSKPLSQLKDDVDSPSREPGELSMAI